MADWRDYQEQAATLLRELGFSAETDVRVRGARATNAIDVVAKYDHAGVTMTWLVECKFWATPVPKEKVWAFRSVLDDIGADRGVLLAERGFQSGAVEAAKFSRMTLTSLVEFRDIASTTLTERRLMAIPKRVSEAYFRYWLLPKQFRIDSGLRPDVTQDSYSAGVTLSAVPDILVGALAGVFPLENLRVPLPIYSKQHAVEWMEEMLDVLELRLSVAEAVMPPEVAVLYDAKQKTLAASQVPDEPSEDEIARARRFLFEPYYPPVCAPIRTAAE